MALIKVVDLGLNGVNVDKNPLELATGELIQAQNASTEPSSGNASIRKRPGLVAFTTSTTAGTVLGGIGVPVQNRLTGIAYFFIGRGPIS